MVIDTLSSEVQKQVAQLSQWIEQQPNLPRNVEKLLILRFLHSCYYDMEKAKTTAQLFFNLRASSPEVTTNRDPLSANIQKALKIVNVIQIRISGNRNLWIWQLNDPGLDNYDYVEDAKVFVLVTDAWLLNNTFLEEGDIAVLDVKDVSLKYLTKMNYSVAKRLTKYQEEALPVRLNGVHIVNAPPTIDKIYAVMKPFMKQELTSMIHFHTPNSPSLFNHISKEDLPQDFGGTLPKIQDYLEATNAPLETHRERLMDENLWKSVKDKSKPSTEIGSFRTLDID